MEKKKSTLNEEVRRDEREKRKSEESSAGWESGNQKWISGFVLTKRMMLSVPTLVRLSAFTREDDLAGKQVEAVIVSRRWGRIVETPPMLTRVYLATDVRVSKMMNNHTEVKVNVPLTERKH